MRKIISVLLCSVMLLALLSVFPLGGASAAGLTVPTGGTELTLNWHQGYVGSNGNQQGYENALKSASSSYRYSDIIHLEKAGTTVWFTEVLKNKCHYTGYVISSWKWNTVKEEYVLDLSGANYQGTAGKDSVVCRANKDGSATYVYTSSKDNEYIRLTTCMQDANRTDYPPVYMKYTGQKGTLAAHREVDLAPVTFEKNGTVSGINWFIGSVGADDRKDGDYTINYEILDSDWNYVYSSIIHIPYAGITITFKDDAAPLADKNRFVISSWYEHSENDFRCDSNSLNYPGSTDSTYSFTSIKDDTYIRLCYLKGSSTKLPTVTWAGKMPEETTTEESVTTPDPEETNDPDTPEETTEPVDGSENAETLPEPSAPETENGGSSVGQEEKKTSKLLGGSLLAGTTACYGAYGFVRARVRKKEKGQN